MSSAADPVGTEPTTNVRVSRYGSTEQTEWNAFVAASRNGTFLFDRAYMDYHADRFPDHSLVVRDADGAMLAVLPADVRGDLLRSHAGLSYGGFVVGMRMTTLLMGDVFAAAAAALREMGIARVLYKTIPYIYHAGPTEEDRYWLFRRGATPFRRDVLSVLEFDRRLPVQERRTRSIRKAARSGVVVRESEDFAAFWEILTSNLRTRYDVDPVHSVPEIRLLAGRFPASIRLWGAFSGDTFLAGAVVYLSQQVCHVQYNASTDEGRRRGALDALLEHLIGHYAPVARYFDFGACTDRDGRFLNAGLTEYKEGFGARTVTQEMYMWDVDAPLETAE